MEYTCREMSMSEEIGLLDIEKNTKIRLIERVERLEMKNEELKGKCDELFKRIRELETDKEIYRNALIQLCADFKKE